MRGTRRGCARANQRRLGRGRHQTRGRGCDGMEPRSRSRRDPDRDGQTRRPRPPTLTPRHLRHPRARRVAPRHPTRRQAIARAAATVTREPTPPPYIHRLLLLSIPSPSHRTACPLLSSASLSLAAAATHSRRPLFPRRSARDGVPRRSAARGRGGRAVRRGVGAGDGPGRAARAGARHGRGSGDRGVGPGRGLLCRLLHPRRRWPRAVGAAVDVVASCWFGVRRSPVRSFSP